MLNFFAVPLMAGDHILHGFAESMETMKKEDNFELEPFKKLCSETSVKILMAQVALDLGIVRRAIMYGHMANVLRKAGIPRQLAIDTVKILWQGERHYRKHFQK